MKMRQRNRKAETENRNRGDARTERRRCDGDNMDG